MSSKLSMWSSLMLPAIVGAEPGDDDNGSNDPGENDENQNKTVEQSGSGDKSGDAGAGDQDDKSGGDPQKKIQAQQEILDRKQAALEQAETELQELRQFKKDQEDEKLSAEEKATRETEELRTRAESLETYVQSAVLENAFLTANEVEWHSPAAAMKLADLSEVKIVEKDGKFTVENPDKLKDALKKLATDNPYLVKTAEEDNRWSGQSGEPSKRRQSNSEKTERSRLQGKYPALRKK